MSGPIPCGLVQRNRHGASVRSIASVRVIPPSIPTGYAASAKPTTAMLAGAPRCVCQPQDHLRHWFRSEVRERVTLQRVPRVIEARSITWAMDRSIIATYPARIRSRRPRVRRDRQRGESPRLNTDWSPRTRRYRFEFVSSGLNTRNVSGLRVITSRMKSPWTRRLRVNGAGLRHRHGVGAGVRQV